MKKKTILLVGGGLSQNHGAEAITQGAIQIIQNIIPTPNIYLLSQYHEDKKKVKNLGVKFIKEPDKYLEVIKLLLLGLFSWIFKIKPKNNFLATLNKCDLVIDISGDVFSDIYPIGVFYVGWRQFISIFLRKPLIIFPQTLGPFKKIWSNLIARITLNYASVIFVREKFSLKYIKRIVKNPMKIKFSIDCAFFLKKSYETTKYDRFFNSKKTDSLTIGICPSQFIVNAYSNRYIKVLEDFSNHVIRNKKSKIILISHVIDTVKFVTDDRRVSAKIFKNIEDKEKCLFIKEDQNADVLKRIISKCDIFIGSRMHSNIASISTNVPTIALSYSHKYLGIMSLYGLQDFVININKFNLDTLKKIYEKVISQRTIIRNKLEDLNNVYIKKYAKRLENQIKKLS